MMRCPLCGQTPSDHSSLVGEAGSTPGGRSRSGTEQSIQSSVTQQSSVNGDYWPHTVFLQTPFCPHAPHALHCAQVLPGITLVVVSQVRLSHTCRGTLCARCWVMHELMNQDRTKIVQELMN